MLLCYRQFASTSQRILRPYTHSFAKADNFTYQVKNLLQNEVPNSSTPPGEPFHLRLR
jgi:hypothetical protein